MMKQGVKSGAERAAKHRHTKQTQLQTLQTLTTTQQQTIHDLNLYILQLQQKIVQLEGDDKGDDKGDNESGDESGDEKGDESGDDENSDESGDESDESDYEGDDMSDDDTSDTERVINECTGYIYENPSNYFPKLPINSIFTIITVHNKTSKHATCTSRSFNNSCKNCTRQALKDPPRGTRVHTVRVTKK